MKMTYEQFKKREKTGESIGDIEDKVFDAIINRSEEEAIVWNQMNEETREAWVYSHLMITKNQKQ